MQSNLQQQAQLQHQHQQLQHQQAHLAMMAQHPHSGMALAPNGAVTPVPMMESASPLSQHASRPATPGDQALSRPQSTLPQQQGLPGGQVATLAANIAFQVPSNLVSTLRPSTDVLAAVSYAFLRATGAQLP